MTIICPNCDSHFRDPPPDIPLERPVQCGKCEHEWLRDGAYGRDVVNPPPLEPSMEALLEDGDAIRTNLPVLVDESGEKTEKPRGPIFVDRTRDVIKPRPALWSVVGLLLLGVVSGGISLMALSGGTPGSVPAIALGDKAVSPLVIGNVETHRGEADGIRRLIVRGEIENRTATQVPIPPIKVTMRGESNVRLYAWTVSAAKTALKAGERSRFTAIAKDYPGDATNVEVAFDPAQ